MTTKKVSKLTEEEKSFRACLKDIYNELTPIFKGSPPSLSPKQTLKHKVEELEYTLNALFISMKLDDVKKVNVIYDLACWDVVRHIGAERHVFELQQTKEYRHEVFYKNKVCCADQIFPMRMIRLCIQDVRSFIIENLNEMRKLLINNKQIK